jgi:hypothetical protein
MESDNNELDAVANVSGKKKIIRAISKLAN